MMKLLKFRVTNFRSVEDSGWIDTDNVTALIGTNESGKTNLLMPLWKLNPAKDGEINPIADYPRKRYNEIRSLEKKPVFIEAEFELSEELAFQIADVADAAVEDVKIAVVKRDFAGIHEVIFPDASLIRYIDKNKIAQLISTALAGINQSIEDPANPELKEKLLDALNTVQRHINELSETTLDKNTLSQIRTKFHAFDKGNESHVSEISPLYATYIQFIQRLEQKIDITSRPNAVYPNEAQQMVLTNLPSFVYYSNYGNLDSEIYLPYVIQNLQRTDLGAREEAKTRTLKVLFEFVKLKPEEIHALGQDFDPRHGENPAPQQIKETAEKKKEREILLQSASTDLTKKFRSWWQQGDYRFRFQADGNFFRIWVSDDRRPEEIELEGRSTGLQWFLSFFLVFLVESTNAHRNAILLLDEPGLSLHPLAQEDLSNFFENLSQTNQLLYTTHSPFMVDPDHLDRVKAVYVDKHGETVVSSDLRAGESNPAQSNSIYPVHAALGLSVSNMLLQGCQPVIVEGTSDQHYLSAMKNYLINKGLLTPKRELMFMPSGGVKGITALASILTAKDDSLPYVVVDSDRSGRDTAAKLKTGLYQKGTDRIISIGEIRELAESEVEDLFPLKFIAPIITRYLPRRNEDFSEVVVDNKPIIPQVEAYAKRYTIELEQGWKVEIAKLVKARMLKNFDPLKNDESILEAWNTLFAKITCEHSMPYKATNNLKLSEKA